MGNPALIAWKLIHARVQHLLLCSLVFLAACASAISLASTPSPLPLASPSPIPSASSTPDSISLNPLPISSQIFSSPSPTESSITSSPVLLSPANAARIAQIAILEYIPWDLALAVAWSPDGQILATTAGQAIHLYNAKTLKGIFSLSTGSFTPALVFSPDGRRLASGSRDGVIRVWDPKEGALLQTLSGHRRGINCISFSPDGRLLLSAGDDAILRLWDLESGENTAKMIGGVFAVPSVVFSLDGESLVSADGHNLRLREVKSQRLTNTLHGDQSFYSLSFSPDGKILASGNTESLIQLWDYPSGNLLNSLKGHTGLPGRISALIWRVTFSPDGRLLASAGGDATLRLWDVSSGKLLTNLAGHRLAVTGVSFSPDGRLLVSSSLDGTVRIWGIK